MTFTEFSAWLKGYAENIDGAPTKKQWKRIQRQLERVEHPPLVAVNAYPIQDWNGKDTGGHSPRFSSLIGC